MNVITDITAQELTQVLKPILQGGRVADLLGEISRLEMLSDVRGLMSHCAP